MMHNGFSPWVVQVIFPAFDKKNLKIVVQIGQSPSNDAPARPSTAHNDIDLGCFRPQSLHVINPKYTSSGIVILHKAQRKFLWELKWNHSGNRARLRSR